ncbi:MAG: TatD family deoxyribonuclease [Pedobacter sp.]|nr:MAG: TatD family deoxyribonuclease [Pedobacter sp.]
MEFLDIHTHRSSQKSGFLSVQSLSLTDDVFLAMPKVKPISVGLHPWYATLANLETHMRYLKVVARQANVKLIGECGLDKLRGEDLPIQIDILTRQMHLAEEINKPIIIHCVKAFSELIALKDKLKVKVPMIIHGFNKNQVLGEQLLNKGFWLSFGTGLLKENSGAANLITKTDCFFLETDDEQYDVEELYKYVASLKKCDVEVLKARIFADWKKLTY